LNRPRIFVQLGEKYKDRKEAVIASYMGLGAIEKEKGDFAAAVELFRKAVAATDEENLLYDAYSWIQRTYQAAGDFEKEQEVLEQMEKRFGGGKTAFWSQIQLSLAEIHRRKGNVEAAEKALRAVADMDNAGLAVSAMNALVRLYNEQKDMEKAEQVTLELAERFPNNKGSILDAQLDRAGGLYTGGRREEALEIYREVAQAGDRLRRRQALVSIMNYQVEMGDWEKAQSLFDTIVGEYSEDKDTVFNARLSMANALRVQQKHAESLAMFEKMMEVAPNAQDRIWTLDGMAATFLDKRDFARAREIYNGIIRDFSVDEFREDLFKAHLGLAALHEMQRDYVKAKEEYEKAADLTLVPASVAQTRASLIRVTAELGDVEAADELTKKLVEDFPANAVVREQAQFSVAMSLASRGRRPEALDRLQTIFDESTSPSIRGQALTSIAQLYAESGKYRESIESFDRIIRMFPEDRQLLETALFGKGRSFMSVGRYDEAKKVYLDIASRETSPQVHVQAVSQAAAIDASLGRLDEAKAAFDGILSSFGNLPGARAEANKGLGNILHLQGKPDEAIAAFRRNLAEGMEENAKVDALNNIAAILSELGRYEEAEKAYGELRQIAPGNAGIALSSKLGKAQTFRQNRRLEEALALYREVAGEASDRTNRAAAEVAVAQVLMEMGKKDEAAAQFEKVNSTYKNNPQVQAQARSGQAEILRSRGKWREALAIYEELAAGAQDDGSKVWALSSKAQVLLEQKQFKDSARVYEKITRDFKENKTAKLDAMMGLGQVYQQEGKTASALATYRKVKEQAPDENRRVWADTAIAQVHVVRREFDEAVKAFRTVLNDYPRNTQAQIDAKMGEANVLKEMNRYDEALAAFGEVLEKHPSSPQAYWALMGIAQIEGLRGDFQAAADGYREAAARFPQSTQGVADSKMNLANLLRSGNRKREALETYEEIVKEFPRTQHAAWALEAIAQIHGESGKSAEARKTYDRLIEQFEDQPQFAQQARFGLAGLSASEGGHDDAIRQYRELLKTTKDADTRAQALSSIAHTLLSKGDTGEAEKTFRQIIRENKGRADLVLPAKLGLGNVYMALKKYGRARDQFKSVADEAGGEHIGTNALQSLAQAYIELGNFNEVDRVVKAIRKNFPTDQNGVINVRMAVAGKLRAEQEFAKALAQLDPVIEEFAGQPQTAWALHARAQILAQMGRNEESNEIFRELIEKYSSNLTAVIDAHMGLAGNAREAGNTDEAVLRYRKVMEQWPEHPQAGMAMNALAQIYQERGEDVELESVLTKLLELSGSDANSKANARISLAALYTRQRRVRQALEQYEKVYLDYPASSQAPWAKTAAARLYNENGDQAAAVKLFEEVIAQFPEKHEAVIGAKAALEEIFQR